MLQEHISRTSHLFYFPNRAIKVAQKLAASEWPKRAQKSSQTLAIIQNHDTFLNSTTLPFRFLKYSRHFCNVNISKYKKLIVLPLTGA